MKPDILQPMAPIPYCSIIYTSGKAAKENLIKSDLIPMELGAGKRKIDNKCNQAGTQYNNSVAKWTLKGCRISI